MYCRECGKEISDDSEFCGHCGATLSDAAAKAGQPPAPPRPPAATTPPPNKGAAPAMPPMGPPAGPPMQPGPYAPPPKKSVLPWVLGGLGLAAIVALVLILVFVVFGGGEADTSGPEQVVETFYKSLEKKDADMLISTIEPSFRSELEDALGKDLERFFEEYFFMGIPEDIDMTIRKMDTEIDGDKAVVTVVDGTMTYTDEYGDEVAEEASESEIEPTQLVRVDGKWYLSGDYLRESGVDPDELKDLDLDELDDTESQDGSESTGTDITPTDDSMEKIVLPIDSEEEAYTALLNDHGIYEWFLGTKEPLFDVTEESDRYVFYLYKLDADGKEVPFWWFGVDKETGAVYEITND